MNKRQRLCSRQVFLMALMLLLGGCAIRSGLDTPEPEVPPAWENERAASDALSGANDWWRAFGSDELNQLVAQALDDNTDLQAAVARVLQAEGQLRQTGASLFPSLSLAGIGRRSGTWGESGSDSYGLDLNASYEVDLWGRLRNNRTAALASLDASRFNRDAVQLTVLASVTNTYLQLRYLEDRLRLARDSLMLAEKVLTVVEAKVRYGAVSPQDLAQQRTLVANQRAQLPDLEQQLRETRYALALLVGESPQGFDAGGDGLAGLALPDIQPDLPAQVLARRPDVGQALAGLMAADAFVAAAKASYWPGITLTGGTGYASTSLGNLLSGDALYSLAASLGQVVFDGGALRGREEVARGAWLEQVANYRATLLTALSEVDQTLGSVRALDQQREHRQDALEQAERSFQLAEVRYREGEIELTSLLDTQGSLISARQNALELDFNQLQTRVTLFRVLGLGVPL